MVKVLSTTLLLAAVLVSGVAHANSATKATHKSTVSYTCQQGKKVKVTYGFNKQGQPVSAAAYIDGKTRSMPFNAQRSDDVSTVFGSESDFSLNTSNMTRKNHRQQAMMITAPSQEILFKSCQPAKR